MKTLRILTMGLLTVALCMGFASCSDDEEEDKQTSELTLNWEIEVSDDLLDVADVTYALFEGKEEPSEPEAILANSTKSEVKGKAPCTLGIYFNLAAKEKPDTQKESYDLSIVVKGELTNENGETVGSSFSRGKESKGIPADQVANSLRTIQKLLDNTQSIYLVDAAGTVEAFSPQSTTGQSSDLQALQKALFFTDEEGKQQPLLGQALDAYRADILSVRVESLEDAKATFLRWMPDAGKALATGDNLTWKLTDEKGGTPGSVYFTATDGTKGEVAKVTFDAGVQPQGITQINFLLSSAWPLNSVRTHTKGDKKRAKAIDYGSSSKTPLELGYEIDCYCLQDAYDDELAYYVGFGGNTSLYQDDLDVLKQAVALFATEQTAKNVQDIIFKPKTSGGWGWENYVKWFLEKDMEIFHSAYSQWINRWESSWFASMGSVYEIDLSEGYQKYDISWHWVFAHDLNGTMYVLVYKGDKLVEGNPVK